MFVLILTKSLLYKLSRYFQLIDHNMSELTNLQLKEIREAFDLFDRDKSGSISAKEMESVFQALGIKASRTEVRDVVRQMDVDGDGEISFDEFKRVMGAQFYRKYSKEEIRAAFRHFDTDNSGYIEANELRSVLSKMGRNYTQAEINRMIKSVDKDGNGMIGIEEFAQLLG